MAKKKKDRFGLGGEVHFQMAPLIDVVFLLLIFFICVTNFDKVERVDLALAYAESAKEYQKDKSTMIVNIRSDGTIVVEGIVFLKGAKEKLQVYMQGVVDEIGGPNFKVAIRADRKARMKEIKDVYRAAAHVGLTRISLVTETRRTAPVTGAGRAPIEGEPPEEELIY